MVVDTVICYWVMVVTATEAGAELLVVFTQDLVAYFYNDYGLIASTQLESLQQAFIVLAVLFDWVGLRTNIQKMVSMDCQTCQTLDRMSVVAYEKLMTGTGLTYREWQRIQVQYLECGVKVATGSMMMHRHSQHGVGWG